MQTREEIKAYCDAVLLELETYRLEVCSIATQFYQGADTLNYQQYTQFEHKLVGMFSFFNAKYLELNALSENMEAQYFNTLLCKAEIDRVKFVAETAKRLSEDYIADLNVTTAKLLGMVNSIEQLLATCRKNRHSDKTGKHQRNYD